MKAHKRKKSQVRILTASEQQYQEDLKRLRDLRPIYDDFMRCLFKDNIPLAELVLCIITDEPGLMVKIWCLI